MSVVLNQLEEFQTNRSSIVPAFARTKGLRPRRLEPTLMNNICRCSKAMAGRGGFRFCGLLFSALFLLANSSYAYTLV